MKFSKDENYWMLYKRGISSITNVPDEPDDPPPPPPPPPDNPPPNSLG